MPEDAPEPSPASETPPEPNVPPKRLGWIWTVFLLILLPLIAVAIWLAGALHQVDERPMARAAAKAPVKRGKAP